MGSHTHTFEFTADPTAPTTDAPATKPTLAVHPVVWQGRIAPAFWTIASVLSLTVNLILIVILIILGQQLFQIKDLVGNQLVGGLYDNFVKMDEARITTNVQVNTTIPVQFDLPVRTNTAVILTENIKISNVPINLQTGGMWLNAPADIELPAGTSLPIALDITVPVDTTVPVQLNVPVDIPLEQTELHEPFVGLQDVVSPYRTMLADTPNSWQEALCQPGNWLCQWIFE